LSGQANSYPFLYQGMEQEFTDPATLYYSGDGEFYSAQISRGLSLVGALGSGGAGGAAPRRAHHGHHHGGGGRGAAISGHTDAASMADVAVEGGGGYSSGEGGGTPSSLPAILEDIYNFFNGLFGGGGSSLPPNYFVFQARLERAGRHPQYPKIDGVAIDIVLNQSPAAPEFCADPHPCNTPPLQYRSPNGSPASGMTQEQFDRFVGSIEVFSVAGFFAGCAAGAPVTRALVPDEYAELKPVAAGYGCIVGGVGGVIGALTFAYQAARAGTLPPPQPDEPPKDGEDLP